MSNKGLWSQKAKDRSKERRQYFRDYIKRYRATHAEYVAKQKKYRGIYDKRMRVLAVEALGGKCVRCGFADIRALQIDHINGGGHKEERKIGRIKIYMKAIKNEDNGYQLLCANCNWIKLFENDEYNKNRKRGDLK